MTTLHLVRQSAFTTNDFYQCIQVVEKNDTVVLIDDGCYNANHPLLLEIKQNNIVLFIIENHAKARGICSNLNKIDMTLLVELTFKNDTVITWQ